MKIEQLKAGQEVTLEVLIGGSSFELKTEVVGTNESTGVLVKPYVYNDSVVDFKAGSPKSMSFSLHCIDPISGGRVVWKNVSVDLVNFKGIDYYAVDSKEFGNIAASSERREDISFLGNGDRVTIGDTVEVNFADSANNTDFSLGLSAKVIRTEVDNSSILYAGKILEKDNKLLAYLCFKGMDEKAN